MKISYFIYPGLDTFGLSIKKTVCKHYKITEQQFDSGTRLRKVSEARKVTYYLLKKLLKHTHVEIGLMFKINQSYISYCCKSIKNLQETDKKFKLKLESIEEDFKILRIKNKLQV